MFDYGTLAVVAILLAIVWVVLSIILAMSYRTVVATNEVHIVQSRRKTTSYGKDQTAGNTYYAWPAWMPRVGIRIIQLPVSVFDDQLNEYAAYDKAACHSSSTSSRSSVSTIPMSRRSASVRFRSLKRS
jgi:flotillin